MAAQAVMEGIWAALTGQDAERFRKEQQELLSGGGGDAGRALSGETAVRRPAQRTRTPERLSPESPNVRRSRRSPSAGRQRSPEVGRQQAQGSSASRNGTKWRSVPLYFSTQAWDSERSPNTHGQRARE
ncbi:hypothetical protein XELAEV_18034753mg [Xenopus laevis]|uniref:Uncharacterized protein n=1 Tax=Xenopus laevis TaxID=8355 RepID=A0A974CFP8_XENLA|nr:hypothetical protein XELAEV_18034753mg [Xenopus laevis]